MTELLQNGRLVEMLAESKAAGSGLRGAALGARSTDVSGSGRSVVSGGSSMLGKGARRQFLAAAQSRLNADWPSQNLSSDEALWRNLRVLRGRSRWLADNNGYYLRFISMNVNNIVGPKGVKLEAKVLDKKGAIDKQTNLMIEAGWKKWGKKGICSRREKWSRVDIERVVVATVVRDGEVFLRKWYGVDNGFGFSVEIIDPMRVPVEYARVISASSQIINGIEYADGEVVAYWIAPRGMRSDFEGATLERVEAKYIEHIYFPMWAEQKRGYPWLAAGMQRIHMLDRYENAEVVQARIAAEAGGYFTKSAAAEAGFSGTAGDEEQTIESIDSEAGNYRILPEGWNFQQFDPSHPTTAFEAFSTKLLKGIASAGNIPYHSLANDLSDVNYSSARIGALEVRDNWQEKQNWFIEWFHEPVYDGWLRMAMSSGALKLSFADLCRFDRVAWIPRSWSWVDPLKEAAGQAKRLEMRTTSISDICAEGGDDPDDVFDRIAKDIERAREKGVDLAAIYPPAAAVAGAARSSDVLLERIEALERLMAGGGRVARNGRVLAGGVNGAVIGDVL